MRSKVVTARPAARKGNGSRTKKTVAVALVWVACGGGAGSVSSQRSALEVPDASGPPVSDAAPPDQTDSSDAVAPAPLAVANILHADTTTNLIVNGDFEDYTDPNVPAGWSVDEIYGYSGMFTPAAGWRGGAVQFDRNAQGQHFLAQDVQVAPNHHYTVQMVFQVVASDSSRGGLYVVDPASGTLIGSDDTNRPTNGWRIASVAFDSGDSTRVTVKIGYPSGMNGTAIYDGVSLSDDDPALYYRYQTTYRDVIGIPAQPVDDLVPRLADYVTKLLAASSAERVAHQTAYAAVLPYYLYQFLSAPDGTEGRAAWCQHTSLALAELLAMYGVPTRQVHVADPQHQFLEYFDGARWVVFDAYYGIRYVRAGVRLGVSEIVSAGIRQVSIEVPTRERVFLLELGFLLPIWDAGAFTPGLETP